MAQSTRVWLIVGIWVGVAAGVMALVIAVILMLFRFYTSALHDAGV